MNIVNLLDRINEVTAAVCAGCGGALGASPSDDFCSPECQQTWTEHHHDVQQLVGYREPVGGWAMDAARWRTSSDDGVWSADGSIYTGVMWRSGGAAPTELLDPTSPAMTDRLMLNRLPDSPIPFRWSEEDARALADSMSAFVENARRGFQQLGQAITRVAEEWQRVTISAPGQPTIHGTITHATSDGLGNSRLTVRPDEDPAARALRMRQQRNTGPRVHADPRRNR